MLLIAKILLKLLVLITLAVGFAVEYINTAEINPYLRYAYIFVMFVCSFSFLFTFIKKYRQIGYIVFILSFISFFAYGQNSCHKIDSRQYCLPGSRKRGMGLHSRYLPAILKK